MSRIGKKEIEIPQKVKLTFKDGVVEVSGPNGILSRKIHERMDVHVTQKGVTVKPKNGDRQSRALHGITRTLIANMIKGVSEGFEKKLELSGLGFKVQASGQTLNLSVGFSHPVNLELPEGVKAKIEGNTKITLVGADKETLGETAAKIRNLRPPEPYKLTGIKYAGEMLIKKQGKTTGTAGGSS